MRSLLPVAAALALSMAPPALTQNFDYYTFALSWSPEYCHENPWNHGSECSANAKWGFVVHGLWPDRNDRTAPQGCAATPFDPSQIPAGMEAIMPREIYQHEWQKHGVCSGMSEQAYFARIASLYRQIKIPLQDTGRDQQVTPSALRSQFSKANPGFMPSAFRVEDTRNSLVAVQVCLNKSFAPLSCPQPGDTRSTSIAVRARPYPPFSGLSSIKIA